MDYQFEKLQKYADSLQFHINEMQLKQFQSFCRFLDEKNQVMNLTAITNPEEVEIKHYMDSLSGAPVIRELWEKRKKEFESDHSEGKKQETGKFTLIDVGTGAGFPGIPLKIMFPQDMFTFMDSLNKRIQFIREAAELLKLQNYDAFAGRAEDLSKAEEPCRESFDFCTSRAVAELPVLLEYCLPFVKVGGYCILYKSAKCRDETAVSNNALVELGGEIEEIRDVSPIDLNAERFLVIVKKKESTPLKYPRRAGKPSKKPLR